MSPTDKPLVWLHGEVRTPPLSSAARIEVGFLLRRLQQGERLNMPWSCPMPSISQRCHELRVNDQNRTWRITYRIDDDAIVIPEVFQKQTQQTPQFVADACRQRIQLYEKKR